MKIYYFTENGIKKGMTRKEGLEYFKNTLKRFKRIMKVGRQGGTIAIISK